MTSKECLEKISWRYVNDPSFQEWCNTIKQNLDKLEKLEKVIEILKDKFKFELGVTIVKDKTNYSLECLYNFSYFTITQEQYDLLKEVLGNETNSN